MIQGRELSDKTLQINSLDGLRGLAILIVFLSHSSNREIYLFPFADFSGIGKSGVFLFFVLSSFLLTLQFIRKGPEAKNKNFLINYFFRRFIRIYPLYSLYLLLGLITSLVLWKIFDFDKPVGIPFFLSFKDFLEHLLLMQGKGLTWTIIVEFRYYCILPILALTYSIIFKNKLIPSIALTVTLIILSHFFSSQSDLASTSRDLRLETYLPLFFMGSLLALIFHQWQKSSWSYNKKVVFAIELLGISSLIMLILLIPSVSSFIIGREVAFDFYHKQFIPFGLLWSMVLFSCVAGLGILRNFFENSFLRYLGFISFSMYLLHIILLDLDFVKKRGADIPMLGWILLILTIGISHLSWMSIEKTTSKIRLINIK
jgi:peptidoglycan/LPS O-acetylase OafA/YrhL